VPRKLDTLSTLTQERKLLGHFHQDMFKKVVLLCAVVGEGLGFGVHIL